MVISFHFCTFDYSNLPMKIKFLIPLLLVFNFASAQFSQDTTLNSVIHDLSGSEQSVPLTATTTDGRTYVSWFDLSSGQYVLRMQLLDINGNEQWGQGGLVVSSYPQSSALFRYDLKVDQDDNAIVAFQDERTSTLQVVIYKLSAAGVSIWGNGIVLQDSTSSGLSPKIAVTSANDVVVSWNASLGNNKWVAYAKISSTGTLQWVKRIWNNQKFSRPVMIPSVNTGFTMLYVQETGNFPGVTCIMYAQQFDSSGIGIWGAPVQVSASAISFFFFPEIISDQQGGFYIAFNTGNPSNPMMNDVYAQHVDVNGNRWSLTGTRCSNSNTEQKLVGGFTTNGSGTELFVALQVLDQSQTNSGISLQKLDGAGVVQLGTGALNLRPISASYFLPVGIADDGAGLIIPYVIGSFGNQLLKALRVDYSGAVLWGYDPTISAVLSNKEDVSTGPFRNGQMILVWQDDRLDAGIYTQNIFPNGGFGPFVGLTESSLVLQPVIFPNPSSSPKLKVLADNHSACVLKITDLSGHLVYNQDAKLIPGENLIRLPFYLASGQYFLSVLYENGEIWNGRWINP